LPLPFSSEGGGPAFAFAVAVLLLLVGWPTLPISTDHKRSGDPSFAIFAKGGIDGAQPATMPLPFLLSSPKSLPYRGYVNPHSFPWLLQTSESPQKTRNPPQFVHVLAAKKATFLTPDARRIHPKPGIDRHKKPKTHHNSPQMPKMHFFHSQLVRPPLLTLSLQERHHHVSDRQFRLYFTAVGSHPSAPGR
jgi:hypothetical protein